MIVEQEYADVLAALQRGPKHSNELFRIAPWYKPIVSYLRSKGHLIRSEQQPPDKRWLYTLDGFDAEAEPANLKALADFHAEFGSRYKVTATTPNDLGMWTVWIKADSGPPVRFFAATLPAALDASRLTLNSPANPLVAYLHVQDHSSQADDRNGQGN